MKYEPEAGDLVWVNLDPRTGREQGGHRPVLVISERGFWRITGMIITCPTTTKIRPFPSSVVLPSGLSVKGEILTGQIRSLDTIARPFKFTGAKSPPEILNEVRSKLAALVGIQ